MKDPRQWSFDIDRYLNHLVPAPPWRHIPLPVAWFLGHRPDGRPSPKTGNLEHVFWAFIGSFLALILIMGVGMNIPSFKSHSAPLIVGSFGAQAVLNFYVIDSPLSQPRNSLLGHLVSSIIGVGVQKLFLMSDDFDRVRWLGGALACAAATSVMALAKVVHPPAGATALLAVVDYEILHLGWFYIPVVMLGAVLMLTVALLIDNIGRRYPQYWWTPENLSRKGKPLGPAGAGSRIETEPKDIESEGGSQGHAQAQAQAQDAPPERTIVIQPGRVRVPELLDLGEEEMGILEDLCQRL